MEVTVSTHKDRETNMSLSLSFLSSAVPRGLFENHHLQARTKILVYKAVILFVLLYGSETWTTYSRHH